MSDHDTAAQDTYALGRSAREYARLAHQGERLRPATRRLFAEAGIGRGMQVLDLGSGAGDVSMLLAEMVGPTGKVMGVDADGQVVRYAQGRAAAEGFSNISFVQADFVRHPPAGDFDAIVGRVVLMYVPDPTATLARLVQQLRPGGIVAFMEPWFQSGVGPDSTLKTVVSFVVETLRLSGAIIDLGPRLHRVFTGAGLPVPTMWFEAAMDGHEESAIYQYIADTAASVMPKALKLGVPGAAELDIASIPARLRAEVSASGYAMVVLPLVSAWAVKAAST